MQNSFIDRELLPLSLLSQWGYCPRRCGLIAIERVWQDNEFTAAGTDAHKRVHATRVERRGDLILLYELGVFSHRLGISGLCDCVEVRPSRDGVPLPFGKERYAIYPIEYKHGDVRDEREYQMQLCAQAMCLEEQYGCTIPAGALFFTGDHRRDEVLLTEELRQATLRAISELTAMVERGQIPQAEYSAKCKKCSLQEECQPKVRASSTDYIKRLQSDLAQAEGDT